MSPADQIDVVRSVELFNLVSTEEIPGTSGAYTPAFDVWELARKAYRQDRSTSGRTWLRRGGPLAIDQGF